MTELVCDREFGIKVDGVERRIVVEWMKPRRDRGDWRCDWIIYWVGRDVERGYAMGVDSAQALLLAMGTARARLEDESPTVRWLDSEDELGLPPLPGL